MQVTRVSKVAVIASVLLFCITAYASPPTPTVEVVNTVDVYATNINTPVALFVQIGSEGSGAIYSKDMRDASTGDVEPYVVPEGKQLVIEYVSMETFSHTLVPGEVYRGMILSPFAQRHLVGLVTSENDFGGFGAKSGQNVKIRVPGGQAVQFGLQANFSVLVNVDLTGHLEDM